MKFLFLISFYCIGLLANPLDLFHILMSQTYEKSDNKIEALRHYEKIIDKSDVVIYNMANILYQQKKYSEAIKFYKMIKDPKLQFQKLYNLGNSYAKNNMYEDAIKSYEDAIKINNKDKDVKINLKIIKKIKQISDANVEKNEDNKTKKSSGKTHEDKDNNTNKDNQMESELKKAKEQIGQKQTDNQRVNTNYQREKEGKLPTIQNSSKNTKSKQSKQVQQSQQIADLEEKKWLNLLSKQELNTLLIPLTKNGVKNDKTINPW